MKCAICGLEKSKVYRHHIKPKSKGGKHSEIAKCCKTCHRQIHMLFTEKELAEMSLKELIANVKMQTFIKWRQKHPEEYKARMSRKVKRWKKYHR
jgi:hypothetical protein